MPLFVVGVGTLAGGALPRFKDEDGEIVIDPEVPTSSRLDRAGLQRIAAAGGGQYFELDRDGDRHIANAIIDAGKRMAPSLGAVKQSEELYWRFLVIAAIFPFLGLPFLRDRPELWILAVGAAAVLVAISTILVLSRPPLYAGAGRDRPGVRSEAPTSMMAGIFLALALAIGLASPALAVDAGKASGTATIDGIATPLAFAVETRKENLFDEKKRDTVVVLTDKALGATKPDDEVELSLRARRGELLVFALRIDGDTLVNVTVSHKGLNGLVILPGAWFQFSSSKSGGTLLLAKRDYQGHSYAVDAAFAAAPYVAPRPNPAPARSTDVNPRRLPRRPRRRQPPPSIVNRQRRCWFRRSCSAMSIARWRSSSSASIRMAAINPAFRC